MGADEELLGVGALGDEGFAGCEDFLDAEFAVKAGILGLLLGGGGHSGEGQHGGKGSGRKGSGGNEGKGAKAHGNPPWERLELCSLAQV